MKNMKFHAKNIIIIKMIKFDVSKISIIGICCHCFVIFKKYIIYFLKINKKIYCASQVYKTNYLNKHFVF